MAQGSKNLSSMRSRRPQGGLEDGPIPAADLQTQLGQVVIVDDGVAGQNCDPSVFDATLQSAAGTGLNGYATGNHMYMWLHVDAGDTVGGDDRQLRIYGYNYALGAWGILRLPRPADTETYSDSLQQCIIEVDAVDAELICVPIHGVDRVAFGALDDAGDNLISDINVRVAFSTF